MTDTPNQPLKVPGPWVRPIARIFHNGRPAIAQWAIYIAQHKRTTTPMHYAETRPIPVPPNRNFRLEWANERPVTTDCSGFAVICTDLAGVNVDPTRNVWDGAGNSTEFFTNPANKRLNISQIKPGDFAVYGPEGDEHIVVIVRAGRSPLVCSHGEEGDPSIYPLSVDTRTPRTFIRVNAFARRVNFPHKD